jgi:hypothetical protein
MPPANSLDQSAFTAATRLPGTKTVNVPFVAAQ